MELSRPVFVMAGVAISRETTWVVGTLSTASGVSVDKSNVYQGQYDGWDKVDTLRQSESSHFEEHRSLQQGVVTSDAVSHSDAYGVTAVSRYYQRPDNTSGPATGTLMMTDRYEAQSSHLASSALSSGGRAGGPDAALGQRE